MKISRSLSASNWLCSMGALLALLTVMLWPGQAEARRCPPQQWPCFSAPKKTVSLSTPSYAKASLTKSTKSVKSGSKKSKKVTKKRKSKTRIAKKSSVKTLKSKKRYAKTSSRRKTKHSTRKARNRSKTRVAFRGGKGKLMGILRRVKPKGLPLGLAAAVVTVESGWRPSARGAAGEIGLMQLKRATARSFGASGNLYNPAVNMRAGTRFLHYCYRKAGGNVAATIGCYNRGPGKMWQWNGSKITRNYVRKVRRMMGRKG